MKTVMTGATHRHQSYSLTHYYKRVERQHLNQVSEQWQTRVDWLFWNGREWVDAGTGLRTDTFTRL